VKLKYFIFGILSFIPFLILGSIVHIFRIKTERLNNENLNQICEKLIKRLKLKNKKITPILTKDITFSEVVVNKTEKEYTLKMKNGDRSLILVHELTHIKTGHADIGEHLSNWYFPFKFYAEIFSFLNEIRFFYFLKQLRNR